MPDPTSAKSNFSRRKHDEVYKFFFSQAPTVAELLEDYLAPDWADQLDLDSLRKLTPEHIGSQLKRRQADMIWRVNFRHRPGFMVLLLEFQSRVDPSMAARVLRYVADAYDNLIRETPSGADHRLPPVVVCVVHNGPGPWDACLDMAHLISPTLPQLRDLSVRLPYQVLDMRALPGRSLRKRRILTWLRELERDGGTGKVRAMLDEVLEAYPGPEHAGIVQAFALWAIGAARQWGRSEEELSEITNLTEARQMYTQIEEEMARLRDEGHRIGHRKGHREGSRTVLERLVAKKFGADAAAQFSGVVGDLDERDQLDAAADAVIECDTVAELDRPDRQLTRPRSLRCRRRKPDRGSPSSGICGVRDSGTAKVRAVLDEVLEAYPSPEHAGIAQAFTLWAAGAARRWGGTEEELSEITNLTEARQMYTQIEEEMARLRDEGHRIGHRKGHREGSRTVLERLVAKKFGADAAAQFSGVVGDLDERDQLDAAADAVIECDTVAELDRPDRQLTRPRSLRCRRRPGPRVAVERHLWGAGRQHGESPGRAGRGAGGAARPSKSASKLDMVWRHRLPP